MARRSLAIAAALLAAGAVTLGHANTAHAGDRHFTFLYDATTESAGEVEVETWVTWGSHKASDSSFDQIDFRHELEFGLTDHLQLGVYLANWNYADGKSVEGDGVNYESSGVELIYNFLDPTKDWLGLSVYGEYTGGPDVHKLEGKLLLQKNIDRWVLGYNAVIEGAWEQENSDWETEGEFQQAAGLSYEITPKFSVGAELLHKIDFPHWSEQGEHKVYAGPNFVYRAGNWWVGVTPMFQITSVETEPDFVTRLILGINF